MFRDSHHFALQAGIWVNATIWNIMDFYVNTNPVQKHYDIIKACIFGLITVLFFLMLWSTVKKEDREAENKN